MVVLVEGALATALAYIDLAVPLPHDKCLTIILLVLRLTILTQQPASEISH